jgi:hypothetical protein
MTHVMKRIVPAMAELASEAVALPPVALDGLVSLRGSWARLV